MIKNWLFTILLGLFSFSVLATEVSYSIREDASSFSTTFGFDIIIEDGRYSDLNNSPNFLDKDKNLYVKFGIDERSSYGYIFGFNQLSVDVEITPIDNNGNLQASFTETLTISYSPDGVSGGLDLHSNTLKHSGYHKYKIHVGSTNISVPANVYLEADLRIDRYYEIAQNIPELGVNSIEYTPIEVKQPLINGQVIQPTVNEVEIWWDYIEGAQEYELEWTWVDNYDANSLQDFISASSFDFTERDFELNNTRILTHKQAYKIPLVYAEGYLIFRVRGVGRWLDNGFLDVNKNKYGVWSTNGVATLDKVADWTYLEITTSHEGAKNWQFQSVYAEEGKKKEIVSYFDGSLRNRQTVTKINSNNEAIVGESIYDNQGRAAIQILPTPVNNPTLGYYPKLNLNDPQVGNPIPFSHRDFDWDDTASNACLIDAVKMSNISGASKYYSPNNLIENNWQDYVPDAKGFPYTQVEYTPDNTGRIRNQSGVGEDYTIDSTHKTQYFYAQPSQEELNRLFGYQVGYSSRYKKNMVVDANGQVSISYLDPQGRVVATSLAGTNTQQNSTKTNLLSLDDEVTGNHIQVETDLLNKLHQDSTDSGYDNNDLYNTGNIGPYFDGLKLNTQLSSEDDNNPFNFKYRIRTSAFSDNCMPTNSQYPYVYDLNININDDCGASQMVAVEKIDNNGSPGNNVALPSGSISTLISGLNEDLNFNFQSVLGVGTYTTNKDLSVNPDSLDKYALDYITNNTCLFDLSDFFIDNVDCNDSINPDSVQFPILTACSVNNGTMRADMRPNGQYGATDGIDPLSIFTIGNVLQQGSLTNSVNKNWRFPNAPYSDQDGSTSYIVVTDNLNGTYTPAVQPTATLTPTGVTGEFYAFPNELLNLSDFLANWQDSWSAFLVAYHPEYCYFEYMTDMCDLTYQVSTGISLSSEDYNAALINIETYAEAVSTTNALGVNLLSNNDAIRTNDPYFNISYSVISINGPTANTFKNNLMTTIMTDYKGVSLMSLYDFCISVIGCGTNLSGNCVANFNNFNTTQKDQLWQLYRSMYLSEKRKLDQVFMDCYTISNGCYNGYIGSSVPVAPSLTSFLYYPNYVFATSGINLVNLYTNATQASPYNPNSINTAFPWMLYPFANTFSNKIQRFIPIDNLYDSSVPEEVTIANTSETVDAEIYAQTGRCNLSYDLEYFLDALAKASALQTTNLSSDILPQLSFDLYEAMGGNANGQAIQIVSTPLINGGIDITMTNAIFSIELDPLPFGAWNDVESISQLYYIPGSFNGTHYKFKALLEVNTSNGIVEVVIGGLTELQIGECNFEEACARPEVFIDNLGHIFTELDVMNYTSNPLTSSSLVGITGGWYQGSELQIQLTDDNSLATITTNINGDFDIILGNQTINFDLIVPMINPVLISGFSAQGTLVSPTMIIYYIDNTGAMLEASAQINYFVSGNAEILDLTCTCIDYEADFELKYRAFLNDLYTQSQNGPIPNGYTSSYLDDLLPYLTVPTPTTLNNFRLSGLSAYEFDFGNVDCTSDLPRYGDNAVPITGFSDVNATFDPVTGLATSIIVTYQLVGGTFQSSSLKTSCFSIPLDSCPPKCIPPTVCPVSCNDKWTIYNTFITQKNVVLTSTIDQFPVYTVDDFCETNLAYYVEAYQYYINTFGIIDNNHPKYLSISHFSNTMLGHAVTDVNVFNYETFDNQYPDSLTWNDYINIEYMPGNSLCPPALLPLDMNFQVDFPCEQLTANIDTVNATNQYGIYIQNVISDFKQRYVSEALNTAVENFEENHNDKQYHYTLYYYDQGGNLIQTVPPKGVDRIEQTIVSVDVNMARLANSTPLNNNNLQPDVIPVQNYETQYEYNSLNQLVWQITPDGGESYFAYDALGRLVVSQNAKQKINNALSYTIYDELGRIIEVGELTLNNSNYNFDGGQLFLNNSLVQLSDIPGQAGTIVNFPSNITTQNRREVTRTLYDELTISSIIGQFEDYAEFNTRNRITGVLYYDVYGTGQTAYNSGTFYDYDVHGNVKELIQDINNADLTALNQNLKKTKYDYDLVSGNVKEVVYQNEAEDQFVHRYCYDADNRITIAETSKDKLNWEKDAKYFYYDHGPLARVEIGDQKVQSLDYAYTIQGWLKGVNSENLLTTADQGKDAKVNSINRMNAKDVMGYSLHYFDGDYDARHGNGFLSLSNLAAIQPNTDLFNGNIKEMFTASTKTNEDYLGTSHTWYKYDQLNRIRNMNQEELQVAQTPVYVQGNYSSTYTYDANGNLDELTRYSANATGVSTFIDNFKYHYNPNNNQLNYVNDLLGTSVLGDDLDGQLSNNYEYDAIGQLESDVKEGIQNIDWLVTGKVKSILKVSGDIIDFDYDPMGNRISKRVVPSNATLPTETTFYFRDAQGNAMSTYKFIENDNNGNVPNANNLYLSERNIYGSSRLGMEQVGQILASTELNNININDENIPSKNIIAQNIGDKRYELANHLGNVLEVISDRKFTLQTAFNFIDFESPFATNASACVDESFFYESPLYDDYTIVTDLSGNKYYQTGTNAHSVQYSIDNLSANTNYNLNFDLLDNQTSNIQIAVYDCATGTVLSNTFHNGTGSTSINFTPTGNDVRIKFLSFGGSWSMDNLLVQGQGLNDQICYTPDVISQSDYYPGGMLLPNRHETQGDPYRYSFQGQESDPEIKGEGNSVNFKYRMHDPRILRFFAVDPLAHEYPLYSPYSFSGNQVIHTVELEGLEPQFDENHRLVGYKVKKGQGPSQIAADLNDPKTQEKYGYSMFTTVTWQDIVLSNIDLIGKDPGITNIEDVNDEGYKSLNVNPNEIIGLNAVFRKEKSAIMLNNSLQKLVGLQELKIEEISTKISKIKSEMIENGLSANQIRTDNDLRGKTVKQINTSGGGGGKEEAYANLGQAFLSLILESEAKSKLEKNKILKEEYEILNKRLEKAVKIKKELNEKIKATEVD